MSIFPITQYEYDSNKDVDYDSDAEPIRTKCSDCKILDLLLSYSSDKASQVEGAEWQRQRKITNSPFNEENSNVVWEESIRQAKELLEYWTSQVNPIFETAKHVRILSLHVLSWAGFGKAYSFHEAGEPPQPGHMYNYRDSLSMILDNIMIILVFGPNFLTSRFLPSSWSRIGQAMVDFRAYMKNTYDEERQSVIDGKPKAVNIMTSLIRASGAADAAQQKVDSKVPSLEGGGSRGLTEAEIYGNTFVYNFAGHDTTAITLGWTLYLLAARPDVQDWVAEEINEYLGKADISAAGYSEVFPKLKRCYAVLVSRFLFPPAGCLTPRWELIMLMFSFQLEVLRLHNPLPGIIKSTGTTASTVSFDSRQLNIPAGARVILHTDAIHTHPQYWGSDAMEWRPQRWIISSREGRTSLTGETVLSPPSGAYAPWSAGARVCPGKKFGQVEFVAIMAVLFHHHRVEPVPNTGESMESARARAMSAVKDSGMILLLQMIHPEKVGLRWVRQP